MNDRILTSELIDVYESLSIDPFEFIYEAAIESDAPQSNGKESRFKTWLKKVLEWFRSVIEKVKAWFKSVKVKFSKTIQVWKARRLQSKFEGGKIDATQNGRHVVVTQGAFKRQRMTQQQVRYQNAQNKGLGVNYEPIKVSKATKDLLTSKNAHVTKLKYTDEDRTKVSEAITPMEAMKMYDDAVHRAEECYKKMQALDNSRTDPENYTQTMSDYSEQMKFHNAQMKAAIRCIDYYCGANLKYTKVSKNAYTRDVKGFNKPKSSYFDKVMKASK